MSRGVAVVYGAAGATLPVAKLAVDVEAPSPDGAVVLECDGVCVASGGILDVGDVDGNGVAPGVLKRAIAQLAGGVPAPRLEGAVFFDGEGVVFAGGDLLHRRHTGDKAGDAVA